MRQKFGSVALYVIEVGKQDSEVFLNKSYTDVKKLMDFKRKHNVSDRMMNIAYEYGMLYSQKLIEIPLDFIEKVSMEEANNKIIHLQGETKMSKSKDYNNKELSVNFTDGAFIVAGDKIKASAKTREFLKKNKGTYNSDNHTWQLADIYKDNTTINDALKKEAMLYGILSMLHQNEARFNEAKSLYYDAKKGGNDDNIEARRYVYNIANIVLYEKISEKGKTDYLDKMMNKTVDHLELLQKTVSELEKQEQTEEIKKDLVDLKANITKAEKYIGGNENRREHLKNLMVDAKALQEMGYLKTVNDTDTLVIASIDHRRVLSNTVDGQNRHESPNASWIDSYLAKKSEQITENQSQNQDTTENQSQNQEQGSGSKRKVRQ